MSHSPLAAWPLRLIFIVIIVTIIDHFPSSFYVNKAIIVLETGSWDFGLC